MNWITPMVGIIAAAVAVPTLVVLYFLKLRRRDLEVSSTFLWKKAIQDLQANAPFQKLRRNILLFLQLLILGGVCLALAQPQIKGQTITGNRHVILLDRSGSMTAVDGQDSGSPQPRLETAKKQAIAFVESLRDGGVLSGREASDEAMVISFDTAAEVRQQFTSDKALLKAAIEAITPTEGPTRLEEAIRLANAHKPKRVIEGNTIEGLTAGLPTNLHLYSDGRIPDAIKAKPAPEDSLEYHRIGRPESANIGIVGMRAAREYDNPAKLGVYVSLENNRPEARPVDVELLIDGTSAMIKGTTVAGASEEGPRLSAAGAARAGAEEADAVSTTGTESAAMPPRTLRPGVGGVVFQLELSQGARVQVRLRQPGTGQPLENDVFALDDRAFLVVPPAKKIAVVVFSDESNSFLDIALSGQPLSRLVKVATDEFDDWVRLGKLGEFDVIVLENWLPPPGKDGRQADLPPGSYLILGQVPGGSLGLKVTGQVRGTGIVDWLRDHPVLRSVSLDRLRLFESPRVEFEPGSGAIALAVSQEGPALIEASSLGVHALIVPFNIDKSSWPVDVSFVVFMSSAIQYLGEDVGAGSTIRDVQPGQVLSDRLPIGAEQITLKLPTGETQRLTPAADGRVTFGPLVSTGIYELSWVGPAGPTDRKDGNTASRGYAANLSDPFESNIGAVEVIETGSRVASASASSSSVADKRLWPYLLLAALAIIMIEWFVYNRKVYI